MNNNRQGMMKEPWMWLVLGLPFSVVVAGFVTLWIAASEPQSLVSEPHRKVGLTVQPPNPGPPGQAQ